MGKYKRLIVCCDGTWQASDKPNAQKNCESNVTRMCRAIKEAAVVDRDRNEVQQIVYYQSGIGTDSLARLGATLQGAHGLGLSENVVEAYNFICLNYEAARTASGDFDEAESDEIFLFGFSRGAYTVRALAGLIGAAGILKKSELKNFSQIYANYQEGKPLFQGVCSSSDMHKVHENEIKIKVIGVWDTVGSLGVPDAWFTTKTIKDFVNSKYKFTDANISNSIENAFQALALDEHRRPFSPTLFHLPRRDPKKPNAPVPNLVQCWFPGVHINCGGGSSDEASEKERAFTDLGQLSYITFAWMIDLCQKFLAFDQGYLDNVQSENWKAIEELQKTMATYQIHQGGYAQGMINDSFETSMAAAGTRTRAPGRYTESNEIATTQEEVSKDTNEYIHPCARIRILKRFERVGTQVWDRATDQRSLAGFQLVTDEKNQYKAKYPYSNGVIWTRTDPVTNIKTSIPEYGIRGWNDGSVKDDHLSLRLLFPPKENGGYFPHSRTQRELEIIQKPTLLKNIPQDLPPAPVETFAGKVGSSMFKFVLGYLPSRFHYWENEQNTTLWAEETQK